MTAFIKDILREIKNTTGRFVSLFVITALGAASIVGIQATSIDMRDTADRMYKSSMLYDIQIKSTIGFDDDDIAALRASDGVQIVMPMYSRDVFIDFEQEVRTARTFSLPDSLNHITVTCGRLPEKADECVVEEAVLRFGKLEIGDTITLMLDDIDDYNKMFSCSTFTIVGTATSPFYISHQRGNTTLADGSINYFLYLHPSVYTLDVYTDAYILMQGSQEIDNVDTSYYDAADKWEKQLKLTGNERVASFEQELADAQKEIDDGWIEYHDGVKEMDEKITDGLKELEDAKIELDDASVKLADGQKELDEKIADAQREINRNERLLKDAQKELDASRTALNANIEQVRAAEAMGAPMDNEWTQIHTAEVQIDEGQAKINSGLTDIAAAKRTLESERKSAQEEIDDGWAEYYKGLGDYEEGFNTLATEKADAQKKLDDAKLELEDAQSELDDAPEAEWFYLTRKDGLAYDSYYQDTLRLQKIGYVFPLVFFLVAIMVSLTTQARMVEEHRTQIGIYKALGYRPFAIMQKYLIYSLTASLGGSVAGVVAGSYIFPIVIADAYGHLYSMPPIETPIPAFIGILAIVLSTLSIVIVTLATCMGSMLGVPAELMRPKPPPIGKRVVLERIPFIWGNLSFIGKVTARNIFRYKKRFLMTLVGIAGCSALLVTAFGLRDGIGGVVTIQYEQIIKYDSRAYTKDLLLVKQREELENLLPDTHLYIRDETVDAKGAVNGEGLSATIVVAEKPESLDDYISLHSHSTGEPVPFTENSILVTEKLARVMGVTVGGSFTMTDVDGHVYTAEVTGIIENYVLHYIYMSPKVYGEIFGKEYHPNNVLILTDDTAATASALLSNDNVRAVVGTADTKDNLSDATDAMGVVTIVLIILACALAFIVLFNLTNINITERIRELATIKVLGFYNNEVSMYVYRENAAVTLMGILAGLVGGVFLHRFVLQSAEIDLLMFPLVIYPLSYVYAIVLSLAFSVFVNLVMNVKLARIDMVESLKNVE